MIAATAPDVTFDAETHRYTVHGVVVPSVTQVLSLAGLTPSFGGVPEETLALAAWKGTCIHEATALDEAGRLDWDALDPLLRAYVLAWRTVDRWVPAETERLLWHPDAGFAGTQDRGKPSGVRDLKTGASLHWTTGLQLAGYALLRTAMDIGLAKAFVREAVHLHPDKAGRIVATVKRYDDPADIDDFLAALRVAQRKLKHRASLPLAPEGDVEL